MKALQRVVFVLAVVAIPLTVSAQDQRRSIFDDLDGAETRPDAALRAESPWQIGARDPQVDGGLLDGSSAVPTAWPGETSAAAAMQGPATTRDTWWIIAPYAWIPGLYGQITSFGQTREVNIDPSDVLSNLHNANGALQLHLESGKGPIGLIMDTNIVRFSETLTLPAGTVNLDLKQSLIEILGVFRLIEIPSTGTEQQNYSIDLLGGGRYYSFFNGVTVTPLGPPQTAIPLGQNATWVDLVVGIRGRAPIIEGIDAFFRADWGGFGIGTSSSLAWNLIAGLSWQMTDHCSLVGGYRVLDIDESQGTGTDRFAFNAKMQGPFMGLVLQY
ncbi:MAG: hypothetical protein ACKV0T_09985 [Planctomycetales bacterium]